jgi:LmbE family N-acetylglucosaminyl deacetylase
LLTAVLLPFVVAGGGSCGFYLQLHRASAALSLSDLPLAPTPPPGRERRILVLSPHCDDETLGLGGTIAQARRNGVPVTVAFLTNGDGFPLAAGRELRDVRLTPADYVRFAERRQQETLRALSALGVDKSSAVFLSYPDRGLIPLWETNWSAAHPYTSRYTGRTHIPYRRAFRPGAPHAGESLLADLTRLMATVRPSDIYVTHPDDDHPDHAASAAFAQAALLQARDAGAPWAREARLRYYLVHRGDWPLPQGRRPNKPLLPPAGLRNVDTRWEVLPLDVRARAAKERALRCYGSQMAVMSRFLLSFVRENELQGVLPESADAASAISPEPLEDDVVRFAGPSADVSAVAMTQDADGALRVRMIMRGPISPRVSYTIRLRAQTKNSSGAAASEFARWIWRCHPGPVRGSAVSIRRTALRRRHSRGRIRWRYGSRETA